MSSEPYDVREREVRAVLERLARRGGTEVPSGAPRSVASSSRERRREAVEVLAVASVGDVEVAGRDTRSRTSRPATTADHDEVDPSARASASSSGTGSEGSAGDGTPAVVQAGEPAQPGSRSVAEGVSRQLAARTASGRGRSRSARPRASAPRPSGRASSRASPPRARRDRARRARSRPATCARGPRAGAASGRGGGASRERSCPGVTCLTISLQISEATAGLWTSCHRVGTKRPAFSGSIES